MSDLIVYLDKLDAERAKLMLYARRFKKLRWLVPKIAGSLMQGLEEEWADLTKERQRTLEVIWADPVLRVKMKDRERAAVEDARKRMVARDVMTALPGKPYDVPQPVKEIGRRVVGLEREEALRQGYLDEALFYYGSGTWQNDGIEVGKLTKLLDELTADRDTARLARHRVLDGLQTRLEMDMTAKHEPVSLVRENLLVAIRAELPRRERDQETPLSKLLQKEMPRRDPVPTPTKTRERSR